jgi:hypothetical protein
MTAASAAPASIHVPGSGATFTANGKSNPPEATKQEEHWLGSSLKDWYSTWMKPLSNEVAAGSMANDPMPV